MAQTTNSIQTTTEGETMTVYVKAIANRWFNGDRKKALEALDKRKIFNKEIQIKRAGK